MSCHGCRVLRKRCDQSCVLRPCLDSFESPEAKAHATLFVSKFFGRTDLINFITSVPAHKRKAVFQSLLFEAVGRTVNPVNGAIGLLSTGNWHLCQDAVRTVLAGGTPTVLTKTSHVEERFSQTPAAWMINSPTPSNFMISSSNNVDEQSYDISRVSSFRCSNDDGDEPKLLNLLV
ncbi:LOB domain-containing protein 39-like protein [Tanacetum coccineum]|uniref:LOB domain-containing protein 39-like protein n=1 Tax=Tanacetum coccineum TaxID=301880 RepID=A0ABQ5I6B3_9ASTR